MDTSFASGKVALVTGATDGIGKETARELLRAGAFVVLHGRDPGKAARVEAELRASTRRDATGVVIADLCSLAAVRRLAAEVGNRFSAVRILVNNAGVHSPARRITEDGFEQTLEVQYLAPFLLTLELLPLLRANAPARIVNVVSRLHRDAPLDAELTGPLPYDAHAAYASSKLLFVLFTVELADRLRGTELTVNAVHPGAVATKLLRTGYGGGGMPVEQGAAPLVRLAAAASVAGLSGRYFERFEEKDPDVRAYDADLRRRIWDATERALGFAGAGDAFDRLARDLESLAALPPDTSAEAVAKTVMCALALRLTPGQAHDVLEAMPPDLRAPFERCIAERRAQPVARYDDATFLARIADELCVIPVHAEQLCRAVFAALRAQIDRNESRRVASQLPRGLKELWLDERPPVVHVAEQSPDAVREALLDEIEARAPLPAGATAADAFAAVMCIFSERLSGGEARDVLECLPASLRPLVARCIVHRDERATTFGRSELIRRIADHLGTSEARAEQIARVVFAAVQRLLPPKEVRDAASQLPSDLGDLWMAP